MVDKNVTIRLEVEDDLSPGLRRASTEADRLAGSLDKSKSALASSSPLLTRYGASATTAATATRTAASSATEFGRGAALTAAAASRSGQAVTQYAAATTRAGAAHQAAATGTTALTRGVATLAASAGRSQAALAGLAASTQRTADSTRASARGFDALTPAMLAVGIGAGSAAKSFMDFDAEMSAVAANTGASGAELESLRQTAIRLGADTQYSGAEAAAGLNELAKAGVSTSDIMGGALSGALSLAAAGQMEVAAAGEVAASAMNQFGLAGADVPHIADMLASAANAAQGSVHDMGMALNQTGIIAAQSGLSIEETVGGLTAFASAGLVGSDAGTSFKTMLMRLTPTTKQAQEAMDSLGVSAYDSNGNFVGLADVAGQLQSSLSVLSEEQRQVALMTIFGSDAIRGANILFNQGADGVRGYIDQISTFGTAQQMAAALTDNLRGDIERLGGAIDSVVLNSGSGLNDFARGAVQGLESLVEVVGAVPAPVLAAAASLVAIRTASRFMPDLGPTFSGWATGAQAFRVEMMGQRAGMTGFAQSAQALGMSVSQAAALTQNATPVMGRFGAAAAAAGGPVGILRGAAGGLVSFLGGPWGVAFAVAGAALSIFGAKLGEAKQRQQEMQAATEAVTQAVTASGGQWDAAAQKTLAHQANAAGLMDSYKQLGYSVETTTAALIGEGTARDTVLGQIDAKIAALANEQLQYQQLTGTAVQYNQAEINSLQAKRDELTNWIATGEQGIATSKEIAAQDDTIDAAARNAAGGLKEQSAAQQDAGATAGAAAADMGKLSSAISALGSVLLSQRDAARGFEAAIDAAEAAVAKNGQTLDATTAKGRANQEALDAIASSGAKAAAALLDSGGSIEEVGAQLDVARNAFIEAARAMGMSAPEARKLANEMGLTKGSAQDLATAMGLIPAQVSTQVSVNGLTEANVGVNAFISAAALMPATIAPQMAVVGAAAAQTDLMNVVGAAKEADAQAPTIVTSEVGNAVVQNALNQTTAAAQTTGAQKPTVVTTEVGNSVVQGALNKTTDAAKDTDAQSPQVTVSETGATATTGKMKATTSAAQEVGRQRPNAHVSVSGTETAISAVGRVLSTLRSFAGQVFTAFTRVVTQNEDGGFYPTVTAYANGGMRRENHVAQIAPAGAWRLWAEDETGGEAYIPLAQSKRSRSTKILEQVASVFGFALIRQAQGSMLRFAAGGTTTVPRTTTTTPVVNVATIPVHAIVEKVTVGKNVKAPFLYTPGGAWDRTMQLAEVATQAITSSFQKLYVSPQQLAEQRAKLTNANYTDQRVASALASPVNTSRSAVQQGRAAGEAVVATNQKMVTAMQRTVATKTDPNTARAAAIANALSMNGRGSYKWGGGHTANYWKNDAALAADCSGFVGWAVGNALGRNATSTAAGMLSGNKSLGYVRIDPQIAAKTAGALMGNAGHVVMSLGDGTVIESYKTGKPVRIRPISAKDMQMAAWNTGFGPMTQGSAAQFGYASGASSTASAADIAEYQRMLAASKVPAYRQLALATQQTARYSRQFLRNIETIAGRGFPEVAARLLEMGEQEGAAPAASFATAPAAALRQQRTNYAESAKMVQLQADLTRQLSSYAGPPAWVTASREAQTSNTEWSTFLSNIERIRNLGYPTLAAKLLEMGVEQGGDIARQAVTLTAKDLRNLRNNLVDQPAALENRQAQLAATALGPRWRQDSTATAKATATTATFLANVRKIADRGFGALALNLMERGEEEAGALAAEAANAASSELRGWQSNLTASDAMARQAQALLDQLRGIGQVLNVTAGAATASDPTVRYVAPAPLDARPSSYAYAHSSRQLGATPQPAGPLLHVENMYAANPSQAATQLETRLGDAVASSGLGRMA